MSVEAIQAILAFANERHVRDPADARFDGKMLWTVYSDGELTTQKAGPFCWGRRTEHVIQMGDEHSRLDDEDALPGRHFDGSKFTHAVMEDKADALKLLSFLDEIR